MNLRALMLAAAIVAGLACTAQAGEVHNRLENQQDRIAAGVARGQLTPGETARLESRDAAINQRRRADLRANGGHLTAAEYRNLNRRENNVSRAIYRDRHNAAVFGR